MTIDCISEYKKIIKNYKNQSLPSQLLLSDSTDKFKLTKHRDGNYPAIITISGFFSEDCDNRLNWQNSVLTAFPDQEWFHLEWNTQQEPFRKKEPTNKPVPYQQAPIPNKLKWILIGASLMFSYTRFTYVLINNWWHLAIRNSRHTGKLLAETIMACQHKEFILVGHSLGARVIHNCLEHIAVSKVETNVKEAHLLGGAVNSRVLKWSKTTSSVKDKIYNYYSKNDKILKFMYSSIMIDRYPVGLQKIDLPVFVNIDSTKYISGHKEYIPNFHIIKKKGASGLLT